MENDLISRSAAIELFKKRPYAPTWTGVQRELRQMPGVDAVEVVRCKDCEYRFAINGHNKNGCPISDRRIWMKDDDFCSHGKRKLTDEEWHEICHHERREENAAD